MGDGGDFKTEDGGKAKNPFFNLFVYIVAKHRNHLRLRECGCQEKLQNLNGYYVHQSSS